jgi:hypothetical protein
MMNYDINIFMCLYSRHGIDMSENTIYLYCILLMSMNLSTRNSSSVFNGNNISIYDKSYYHYSYQVWVLLILFVIVGIDFTCPEVGPTIQDINMQCKFVANF